MQLHVHLIKLKEKKILYAIPNAETTLVGCSFENKQKISASFVASTALSAFFWKSSVWEMVWLENKLIDVAILWFYYIFLKNVAQSKRLPLWTT